MTDNFLEIFLFIKFPVIGLFVIFALTSFFWTPIFNFLKLKTYKNIQRVHENEVSRLGGLIIYLFFWVIHSIGFFDNDFFFKILISVTPFLIISIKEDLFHNTNPKSRLILMVISCLIFFYINPIKFPVIDIPFVGQAISSFPINIIFFSFCILIIMNGTNFIDGVNGLFGFTVLFQLISILFLAYFVGEYSILKEVLILIFPIIIFLFFNFPLGKIFVGDFGTYLYGFFISVIIITLLGKNPHILSWVAVFILIYPSFELLFSYIRKKISKTNPMSPDPNHLHSLLFLFFLRKYSKLKSNYLTTVMLLPLTFFPLLIYYVEISLFKIMIMIVCFSLAYIGIYFLIKKTQKK